MALTVRYFFKSQYHWPCSKLWSKFQSTFWALLLKYFCRLDTLHSKYSFERNYPQAWIENVEVCILKQGLNNFNFLHYSAIGDRGQRCLWRFHSKDLETSSLNKWECRERSLIKGPQKFLLQESPVIMRLWMDHVISWWRCQYLSRRQSYRFIAFHTQGKNALEYTRNVYVQTKQM